VTAAPEGGGPPADSSATAGTAPSAGGDLFGLDDGIDDVAPRPRRRRSKLTTALAAIALVGAGAIGGIAIDQRWGPDANASSTPRFAGSGGVGSRAGAGAGGGQGATGGQTSAGQGATGQGGRATGGQGAAAGGQGAVGPGRGSGGGFGGFGGRAGAAAVGRVTSVDGSTLVVTANDGSQVKVETKGATITQPTTVDVSALTAGELVIVQGTTNPDGTVTATQVTANNGAGGGFGGFGGGGGAGGRAAPTTAPAPTAGA